MTALSLVPLHCSFVFASLVIPLQPGCYRTNCTDTVSCLAMPVSSNHIPLMLCVKQGPADCACVHLPAYQQTSICCLQGYEAANATQTTMYQVRWGADYLMKLVGSGTGNSTSTDFSYLEIIYQVSPACCGFISFGLCLAVSCFRLCLCLEIIKHKGFTCSAFACAQLRLEAGAAVVDVPSAENDVIRSLMLVELLCQMACLLLMHCESKVSLPLHRLLSCIRHDSPIASYSGLLVTKLVLSVCAHAQL